MISFFLFSTLNAFSQEAVPLKVVINGEDMGEFFVVLAPGDDVWIKRSDLDKNNLIEGLGKDVKVNGDTYVSLKSISGITFFINEKEASLEIQATPHLFKTQTVDVSYKRPYEVYYPKDTSAFLNYGLLYNSEDTTFDLATEVGFHYQDFFGMSTFNYHKDEQEEKIVRLMTSLQSDDRKNLRTVILGDFPAISGILGSGGPLLGGVNVSKNFQIDPYYLKYPSLSLSGALLAPSEVGVYINDMLLKRETLPPGEFLLKNIPGEVGLGTTKIVIRDIYGVERVITQPFYYSDSLLKPGIQAYSYSLGFLREDFGEESFSYGNPAFLAFHKYGFSNNLTAGYAAEMSNDLVHMGPTASVLIPEAGVLDLAFIVSESHGKTGFGGFLGHSFRSKYVDTVLALTSSTENFSNLTVGPSDDKPTFQFTGAISFREKNLGSVTTQYSKERFHIGPDTSELSFSYNRVVTKRATFFATASWLDVEGLKTKNEVFCGLNIYFGRDVSGLFSYTSKDGENLERATVTKSLPVGPGFGFIADVENHNDNNNRTDVLGEIKYQNDYGIYGIGYNKSNEREIFQASVSGGIGIIDGSIFLSRPLDDSFAKVKVADVEGVRIYADGNVATRTNEKGEAIIPSLRSYQDNKIDIENDDIPIDYSIPTLTKYINPSLRSGSLVTFDIEKIQGFVGNVYVRLDGEKFPAESTIIKVQLKNRTIEGLVGKDGEFYLENLSPGRHLATILYNGKECIFDIIVPETEEAWVNLGKVTCELKQ